MAKSPTNRKKKDELKAFVGELSTLVDDAKDFIKSELEPQWAKAERYYKGETDLGKIKDRSSVVKTEVRDAIRNTLPSIMRVLLQSRHIVEYMPSSVQHSPWVDLQTDYVHALFYENDGYRQVYNSVLESLKLKIGPQKVYWEEAPSAKKVRYTNIPSNQLDALLQEPDFELEDYEETPDGTYNIDGYQIYPNGLIRYEAVPNYEFFISRNSNSIEHAIAHGVHGQSAVVTVTEAIELGLEYDDWEKLDYDDPEANDHAASSRARRRYHKDNSDETDTSDVSTHKFLLTEVYVSRDLKGRGTAQLYCVYLGGTAYEYLSHEEVEDSPYSILSPIPESHTVYSDSIADLTINEQDTSTSILRSAVDNVHLTNNSRYLADPRNVSFDDLVNPALNAPIRVRNNAQVQTVQIPSTLQGSLGLLSYLDLDVQQKVGVTKAAQGLDPDALQSTNKDAVMNTIQTSQGQVELMVRNIVETGLIRVFRLMLRLACRHMNNVQLIRLKGKTIPVDLSLFDPDAVARPTVGIGTGTPQQKVATLSFIYSEQKQYMQQFGPNNPFTSYAQIYNTLEDLMDLQGITATHRYFNIITPSIEQQWGDAQAQQQQQAMDQAAASQPIDPSKAFVEVEQLKARIKELEIATRHAQDSAKLEHEIAADMERLDLERDRLNQDRVIRLAELGKKSLNESIKKEANANDGKTNTKPAKAGRGNVDTGE